MARTKAGIMYRPTDIAHDVGLESVYVVEQFNSRVSSWIYNPNFSGDAKFNFLLEAGQIKSITIMDGGSGFTSAPTLTIQSPTEAGNPVDVANLVTATATATLGSSVGQITSLINLIAGSGYLRTDAIALSGGVGNGATATATIHRGRIETVTLTSGGTGYMVGNVLTIIGTPSGAMNASIQVGSISATTDEIVLITITNFGSGYGSVPTVTVTEGGGGSGADLTAVLTAAWGNNGDGTTGQSGSRTSPTDNFLNRPTGITFDGDRLIVTDTFNHRIRTINALTGAFLGSTGQGGKGLNDFYRPTGISVNVGNTKLVIADEFNSRAVRYDVGDTPVNPLVLSDPNPKEFVKLHGVSYDETQTEFVVSDTFRNVLSRYDDDGNTSFIGQIGKASGVLPDPPLVTDDALYYAGSGSGKDTGDLLVFANTRRNSLKTKSGATTLANIFQNAGTGDGQLYWAESTSVFTDATINYLLVVNTRNNRIEVFEQPTTFKSNFGG